MQRPTTEQPKNSRTRRLSLSPYFLDEIAMTRSDLLSAREGDLSVVGR
jgi:hypothetical protein